MRIPVASRSWLAQAADVAPGRRHQGRVIARLKSQNELRYAMIVFLSDDGFLFRAPQLYAKRLPYTSR